MQTSCSVETNSHLAFGTWATARRICAASPTLPPLLLLHSQRVQRGELPKLRGKRPLQRVARQVEVAQAREANSPGGRQRA